MYRNFSPDEHRKHFSLPENYQVSGFLCHGTWKRDEEIENLQIALKEMGISYSINELPGFLRRMVEIKIGSKNFWFDVPYGSARLSEYLQLACLFGSKKNILIGTCGGLSPKINSFDIIVPTFSYGEESSAKAYASNDSNKYYPDKKLRGELIKNIKPKFNTFEGPTITWQAMLGETREDIQKWSDENYLGVEMEASTVFSVSSFYKVPSAAALVVADNLIKNETTLSESYKDASQRRYEIRQELIKILINILLEE